MNLPLGYSYSAVYAGIRKVKKDDLAVIVSDKPASAAAVFTQNRVQAAPVTIARHHLQRTHGKVKAILINAGNANCATATGSEVAIECCRTLATQLGVEPAEILPASTGVIGVELEPGLITNAVPALVGGLKPERFEDVARAIMTTDLTMKTSTREAAGVRIAGMTKGSGMIQPNMATTLGFVMMDAEIAPATLAGMLERTVAKSYNSISVDGDTSTNDTLAVLANGAAGVNPTDGEREDIEAALREVLEDLAKQIARDGEGARKLITIEVEGAEDDAAAGKLARSIANSPLVKTAIGGSDPNWGRILCAAGYAGVEFDPRQVDVLVQHTLVCRNGLAADFGEAELKGKLDASDVAIKLLLHGAGPGTARFWTCDLTEKYIEINGSYRT